MCVCVSDSGAQRRNVWAFYLLFSLLFIFSALWWTWTVTCEDLCGSVEDVDYSPGASLSLLPWGKYTYQFRAVSFLPPESSFLSALFDSLLLLSTALELGSGPPVTSLSSLTSPALCNLTRNIAYSTLRVGFLCFLVSGRLFSCFIFIVIIEIVLFSWGPLWQHCPGFAWSEHSTLTSETPTCFMSAHC